MSGKRCTAIVLAAGSGKRMHSATAKQFLPLGGRPLICHSLQTMEESEIIDNCILVTGEEDIVYVRQMIVEKYGFRKVEAVVPGGRERYESVYSALCFMEEKPELFGGAGYIFIHDGARPFVTEDILRRTFQEVCRHRACVAGMPVKDTVKIADENGFVTQTLDRNLVWAVQTPQVFEASLITDAYRKLFELPEEKRAELKVTDDAMVLEAMLGMPVKLTEGSYRNIKITTPEDIRTAEGLLQDV